MRPISLTFGCLLTVIIIVLTVVCGIVSANTISFELPALGIGNKSNKRCLSLYIGRDVMVSGKYVVSPNTGSQVNFEVRDEEGQVYSSRKNAGDLEKFSFTSHNHLDYLFCFANILNGGNKPSPEYSRSITFTVNVGADAIDEAAAAVSKDNVKPMETELKSLEQTLQGIIDEMEYLKRREARMRDTNESTNSRVKWFSLFSICVLIGSGLWQIYYLKKFFESKKIL